MLRNNLKNQKTKKPVNERSLLLNSNHPSLQDDIEIHEDELTSPVDLEAGNSLSTHEARASCFRFKTNPKPIDEDDLVELPASQIGASLYQSILDHFYGLLSAQTTLDRISDILHGDKLRQFVRDEIANKSIEELTEINDYFICVKTYADSRHDKKIDLLKRVKDGREILINHGYINSRSQTSAAFFARTNELKVCLTPKDPKTTAFKDMLFKFTLLSIAETIVGVSVRLFDELDADIDFIDVQKYITPAVYTLTLLFILFKGVYDYHSDKEALKKFLEISTKSETEKVQYDRDIAAVVVNEVAVAITEKESVRSAHPIENSLNFN